MLIVLTLGFYCSVIDGYLKDKMVPESKKKKPKGKDVNIDLGLNVQI
jgi:hypothetical protein